MPLSGGDMLGGGESAAQPAPDGRQSGSLLRAEQGYLTSMDAFRPEGGFFGDTSSDEEGDAEPEPEPEPEPATATRQPGGGAAVAQYRRPARTDIDGDGDTVALAGVDEGLLPFSLPIFVYMDNPYRCNK